MIVFFHKRYDENGEVQIRRRSPTIPTNNGIDSSTEISFAGSSSLAHQQQKHRSNTQMTDRSTNSQRHCHHRQSKLIRAQSRTHSTSSDERIQVNAISPRSSNDTSDDDDPNSMLSQRSRLRRKYVKSRQATPPPLPPALNRQQSLREQPPTSTSPTLKYASNGVLLRTKHHHHHHHNQQHSTNIFQRSSKDMGKKVKRFTLDAVENRWHNQISSNNQPILESNVCRSSMAIVPSLNANVYGIQINNPNQNLNLSLSSKQAQLQQRDDPSHNETQSRLKV